MSITFGAIVRLQEDIKKFGAVVLNNQDISILMPEYDQQKMRLEAILHGPALNGELPIVFTPDDDGNYTMFYVDWFPIGNYEQIMFPTSYGWRAAKKEDFEGEEENTRLPMPSFADWKFGEEEEEDFEEEDFEEED